MTLIPRSTAEEIDAALEEQVKKYGTADAFDTSRPAWFPYSGTLKLFASLASEIIALKKRVAELEKPRDPGGRGESVVRWPNEL